MGARPALRLGQDAARVRFRVRWFGILTVRGTFRRVFAELRPVLNGSGERGEGDVLSVRVESASVDTGIGLRDRHLRGPRFLDAGAHPVIAFESDAVMRKPDRWEVRGRLTLRGQVHVVNLVVPDEDGQEDARWLRASFTVPRRPSGVGRARGLRRLNPLLWAIGDEVAVQVELLVPAGQPTAVATPARVR